MACAQKIDRLEAGGNSESQGTKLAPALISQAHASMAEPAKNAFHNASHPTQIGPVQVRRSFHVALVDDDESAQLAVRQAFAAESIDCVLDGYLNGHQALQRIPKALPDVVLMDLWMPGLSGIDCTRAMRSILPNLPIVMVTACSDPREIIRSLMCGALGYLVKPVSPDQLVEAVIEAINQRPFLCQGAQLAVIGHLHREGAIVFSAGLTKQERRMLTYLADGMRDKEIAEQVGISVNTVHAHLVRIFRKMHVHNRAEAIRKLFFPES